MDAIRGMTLKTVVNFTFNYTPKDQTGGRAAGREYVFQQLDSLGMADGNRFIEAEGVTPNFYFNFEIYSDDQDRYTGSAELAGWGQGHIVTKRRTENSYSNPISLIKDLLSDLYGFIHTGWFDPRPECKH